MIYCKENYFNYFSRSDQMADKSKRPSVLEQFATFALFMNILETKQPDMLNSRMLLLYKILGEYCDSTLTLMLPVTTKKEYSRTSILSFPDFIKENYWYYNDQTDQKELKYTEILYQYTGYLTLHFDFRDVRIVKKLESVLSHFYKNNKYVDLAIIYLAIYKNQLECLPKIKNTTAFSIIKMQLNSIKDKIPKTEKMVYTILCNIHNAMTKQLIDDLKKPTAF